MSVDKDSMIGFLATVVVLVAGCATQASLMVLSQPEGAFITEKETGTSYGTTPLTVVYDGATLLRNQTVDGCYLTKGLEARWVSGIVASLEFVRLCGSNVGNYSISFSRDPAKPGLNKDLQFALQLQGVRAQQQQAQAVQDAAAAAFFQQWANSPRTNVNCTSTQIGNTVQTNCR